MQLRHLKFQKHFLLSISKSHFEDDCRFFLGEWKIPLNTWNEGFEVCKCFDDGEVVLAKLRILADGCRGKQRASQDMVR